jgi:hypothetical protein
MTSLRQRISSRAVAAAEADPRVEFLLQLLDEYVRARTSDASIGSKKFASPLL